MKPFIEQLERGVRRFLAKEFQQTLNIIAILNLAVILYFVIRSITNAKLDTTIFTIFCGITVFLLLREHLKKISFAGLNAEIDKEVKKTKSLYWTHKGDSALYDADYNFAEYYFRTALKKDEDVSLAHIGIADSIRQRIASENDPDNQNKVESNLQEALNYCVKAIKIENKLEKEGGTPDRGPVFLLMVLILIEAYKYISNGHNLTLHTNTNESTPNGRKIIGNKNDVRNAIKEFMNQAKKEFDKTCMVDVIAKGEGSKIYGGEDILKMKLNSDIYFCKFRKNAENDELDKELAGYVERLIEGK